jgi:thiosulfate/3-mercaptopyruvate sulfurtransferase
MSDEFDEYAHPEVLVNTDWVAEHLDELQSDGDEYRLVEVDVDTEAYDESHIPGAVGWDWESELCDTVQRDLVPRDEFEDLLEESGISDDTTIILYGDNHNWFAAWALWQLKYYGHDDVRLMDGGRAKWLDEDRELTQEVPSYPRGSYSTDEPDESIRTYAPDIQDTLQDGGVELVDVRSEPEFTGEKIAPEGMSETAQRGGHIPGATNIGWAEAVNEDSTFKSREELEKIYEGQGIGPDDETVTYCRIGERSSFSWFVLHYLLGHENVKNYDGSWTEWGNLVGAPIETGK